MQGDKLGNDFYSELSDKNLLKLAWHLARDDSRTDFINDPFRFTDFGFYLDEHIRVLSQQLSNNSYYAKPLIPIDVPKSTLSVRPGSNLEIEDKIVLFAIAWLIAIPLDKKLPETVYSWRVKKDLKKKKLFEDRELLSFPFLKRKTIRKRIDFVEPWYQGWPRFIQEMQAVYENQGYEILIVSDIVSYFENLDLSLLGDLLLAELPKQSNIIHFLLRLLETWTWPTFHGSKAARGIPQGNGVSSFLGNIYLLPLDREFSRLSRKKDIKYFRYMDDVKIFAKDMHTARQALFHLNEKLRSLRLNIQGSKTMIIEGRDIRNELFDERLERVNEVIEYTQENKSITDQERLTLILKLSAEQRRIGKNQKIISGHDLRLFRRIITGHILLQSPKITNAVLKQVEANPDSRLLGSAFRYLRAQKRNISLISTKITSLLQKHDELFYYQTANYFRLLKYLRYIPNQAFSEARNHVRRKSTHWYVKQQAWLLLLYKPLNIRQLEYLKRAYSEEDNIDVKRALLQGLSQLSRGNLIALIRKLILEPEPRLQRVGRLFWWLTEEKDGGINQIRSIFDNFYEDTLVDRLYEVELLAKSKHPEVRQILLKAIRKNNRNIRLPILKERVQRIAISLS